MKTAEKFRRYGTTLALLLKDCPEVDADDVITALGNLGKLETQLTRLHERQCNGHQDRQGNWDQGAAEADEKREARLRKTLTETLAVLGLQARVNCDPRGYAIRLLLPSGRSNTMDGETWALWWVG